MRPLLAAVTAEARDQLDAVVLCGDVPDEPPSGAVPWRAHAASRPTYLLTPPSLTRDLLEHAAARAADFSRLRYWIVGGDTCPAAVHALMADVVRKPLLEICGMTETGFYCISPPHGLSKPGSIGQAMMGVAVRVVTESGADTAPGEVGRVLVRTPDMMVGYWNDTLATHRMLRSGWLDTEDLASTDEDGFLWFAGRQKDMISRGGFKVAPAMVEDAILSHPGVATAAVVGASDEREGQVPVAFYELRPSAVDPGTEALAAWAAARLEPLSVPVSFFRVDRWPLTAQGKLDRARLVWMADFGDGREL